MKERVTQSYTLLDLEPGAGREQIRQAYRDLVQVWHPDRFTHSPRLRERAERKLTQINGAYQLLMTGGAEELLRLPPRQPAPEVPKSPFHDETTARLHAIHGSCLADMGQHVEAIIAYRKALAIAPQMAAAKSGLGRSLAALRQCDEAIPVLRDALKGQPRDPAARLALAECLEAQGQVEEALRQYRMVLLEAPAIPGAERIRRHCQRLRHPAWWQRWLHPVAAGA